MRPHDAPVKPGGHRASRRIRRITAGAVLGALVTLVVVGVPTGKAALLAIEPTLSPTPSAQSLRAPAHTCLTWQLPDAADAAVVNCSAPHLF
ncbi:MAG: hypothetical protein ACRDQI_00270 [Pseudonocardiaceae bacterium]